MLKYFVALLILLAIGVAGFFTVTRYSSETEEIGVQDYRKVTTVIDGDVIQLGTRGTAYFGNESHGDINDDGIIDVGFIVTRDSGGSGTFYYAVAALWMSDGNYIGTNAVYLGDRIAPQTTDIRQSIFKVNYADRNKDEPFSTPPSTSVTAYLYYQDGELRAEWPIYMYFYNPALDTDSEGNVLCSEKGLVRVPRLMPDATPELAVKTLIKGQLLDDERAKGITTEFPLEGFSVTSSQLTDGVLSLTFDDPNMKTSGGSCRINILRAQIEATAKQFDDVREVRLLPETLFQP